MYDSWLKLYTVPAQLFLCLAIALWPHVDSNRLVPGCFPTVGLIKGFLLLLEEQVSAHWVDAARQEERKETSKQIRGLAG